MNLKFFSFVYSFLLNFFLLLFGYFYFFKFNFWILVFKIQFFLYFQLLFFVPKVANIFIKIYKRNFIYFYSLDFALSSIFFLCLVNYNLEILFPIIGVVYNRILFEDEDVI